MGPMKLDALEAAVARLEPGLARSQENLSDELLRDGVIQRFEYTYEACWKALKRYIQTYLSTAGNVDEMSLQDLIRTGNEAGLLLSDDLAVKGPTTLVPGRLQALRDAFAESDLPIKVDVVDLQAISASFREAIKADLVPFQAAGS